MVEFREVPAAGGRITSCCPIREPLMRKLISAAFLIAGLVTVGCAKDKDDDMDHKDMDHKKMATTQMSDCCPKCPGDQKMTADGKCPMCKMKVM